MLCKMFSLSANPDYTPGGIQNFWTTTPPAAGGVAAENCNNATAANMAPAAQEPRSFAAWFFVNPKMADKTTREEEGQKATTALMEKKARVEQVVYAREKVDIANFFFFNQTSLSL